METSIVKIVDFPNNVTGTDPDLFPVNQAVGKYPYSLHSTGMFHLLSSEDTLAGWSPVWIEIPAPPLKVGVC